MAWYFLDMTHCLSQLNKNIDVRMSAAGFTYVLVSCFYLAVARV